MIPLPEVGGGLLTELKDKLRWGGGVANEAGGEERGMKNVDRRIESSKSDSREEWSLEFKQEKQNVERTKMEHLA